MAIASSNLLFHGAHGIFRQSFGRYPLGAMASCLGELGYAFGRLW
ncbi:hypothetical protein [Moorena producens]